MISPKKIHILLFIIPILIFLLYFFHLWNDIPVIDDYWYLNDFIVLKEKTSLARKFEPLFITRNSHRCVPSYIFGYLQMAIFDQIRPKFMLIIGLFSFLGIIFISSKVLLKSSLQLIFPLLLLTLNPNSFSLTFFPLVSIQVFFTFFVIFYLNYHLVYKINNNLLIPILLAIVITFSNGNGMLIWPSGFLVLFISKKYSLKNYLIWTLFGIISILLYFTNMKNEGVNGNIVISINYISKLVVFIFSFLGNAMDFWPSLNFSNISSFNLLEKTFFCLRIIAIFGFPILFSIILIKRLSKKINIKFKTDDIHLIFIIGIFTYVFLSAIIGGIFRANEGFGMGLSYRYKFYGQIIIILFIILISSTNTFKWFVLQFSLLYFILSYLIFYPYAKNFNNELIISNLNLNDHSNTCIHESFGNGINKDINEVLIPNIKKNKIFLFDDNFVAKLNKQIDLNISGKEFQPAKNMRIIKNQENIELIKCNSYFSNFAFLIIDKKTRKKTFLPVLANPIINWGTFEINNSSRVPILYKNYNNFDYNKYLIELKHNSIVIFEIQ